LKKYLLLIIIGFFANKLNAQTIDSLYFNLYTDSLKKGTYNYINVDAKLTNGRYLPLTDVQLEFKSSAASFDKNCIVIPFDFKEEKVTITVTLKSNKNISKSITLYIKKKPDDELPTKEQIMNNTTKPEKVSSKTKKKKSR
jgi:hypothetical protein